MRARLGVKVALQAKPGLVGLRSRNNVKYMHVRAAIHSGIQASLFREPTNKHYPKLSEPLPQVRAAGGSELCLRGPRIGRFDFLFRTVT